MRYQTKSEVVCTGTLSLPPNVRRTRSAATTTQRNSMNHTLICFEKWRGFFFSSSCPAEAAARQALDCCSECSWSGVLLEVEEIFPERRINTAESLLQDLDTFAPLFILGWRLMNLKWNYSFVFLFLGFLDFWRTLVVSSVLTFSFLCQKFSMNGDSFCSHHPV